MPAPSPRPPVSLAVALALAAPLAAAPGCLAGFDVFGRSGQTTTTANPGAAGAGEPMAASGSGGAGGGDGIDYDDPDFRDQDAVWIHACWADFAELQPRWARREKAHAAALARASAEPNLYLQRRALDALAKQIADDANAEKLAGSAFWFAIKGGVGYEVDRVAAELYRGRGIHAIPRASGVRAYPPFADLTVARDVYCELAENEGTHKTPRSGVHYHDMLVPARQQGLTAYHAASEARIAKDFANGPVSREQHTMTSLPAVLRRQMTIGKGAHVELEGLVHAIRRTRTGGTLELRDELSAISNHDCIETNRVDHIDAGGRVRYRELCKQTGSTSELRYLIELSDLPPELAKGDWVKVETTLERLTYQGRHPTGAPRKVTLDLDGLVVRLVARAERKGQDPSEFKVLGQY